MEIDPNQILALNSLPFRTPETEKWYRENYKYYWLNNENVPSDSADTQTEFIIDTLKEQLDIDKIETVLDVGIGYGRVARAILDTFPVINLYDGFDIAELAIKQSEIFLDDYVTKNKKGKPANNHTGYCYMIGDFEDYPISECYDLVISTETLSALPSDEQATKWLDKMVSLSKKYVVNVDYHESSDSNIVFNIARNYPEIYRTFKYRIYSLNSYDIPDYKNERMYIARVV